MYKMLLNQKDFVKKSVQDFCKELIKVPSPSLNEAMAADVVAKEMYQLGYDKVFTDECGNVVGIIYGGGSDGVILNSHIDTVDAENSKTWDSNPFGGKVQDGKIFGLGASDCKGGLAAQVYAGAMLKRSMLPLKGNIVVCASVAEENGRSIGVRALIEKTLPSLAIHPEYVILGEPTGLGLYYGHDGRVEVDISVEGANPYHVEDAAKAIFNDLNSSVYSKDSGLPEFMQVYKPSFKDIKGIKKASIQVEKRLLQDESLDGVIYNLKHNAMLTAQTSGAVAVDVAVAQENQQMYTGQLTAVRHITHAWQTDPYHPLMSRARQALAAAGCEVRTGKWQLSRLGMGTAGSLLVKDFKIPTIGYGPGLEELAHAINEYVEIDKVNEAVFGTAAVLHSLIGVPVFGWTADEEI